MTGQQLNQWWPDHPANHCIYIIRADSRFMPSQWEMALLCNDISHWLGTNLESALYYATLASSQTVENDYVLLVTRRAVRFYFQPTDYLHFGLNSSNLSYVYTRACCISYAKFVSFCAQIHDKQPKFVPYWFKILELIIMIWQFVGSLSSTFGGLCAAQVTRFKVTSFLNQAHLWSKFLN